MPDLSPQISLDEIRMRNPKQVIETLFYAGAAPICFTDTGERFEAASMQFMDFGDRSGVKFTGRVSHSHSATRSRAYNISGYSRREQAPRWVLELIVAAGGNVDKMRALAEPELAPEPEPDLPVPTSSAIHSAKLIARADRLNYERLLRKEEENNT